MIKDDPDPLLSEFSFAYQFNRPEFIPAEGAGGFYISPMVHTPYPVYSFLDYPNKDLEGHQVSCTNGYSKELIEYRFPDNIQVLAKPNDFSISENHLTYTATYELKNNVLTVSREIDDRTPGNVCEAELMNAQRQTAIKIAKNAQSQIVFQYQ